PGTGQLGEARPVQRIHGDEALGQRQHLHGVPKQIIDSRQVVERLAVIGVLREARLVGARRQPVARGDRRPERLDRVVGHRCAAWYTRATLNRASRFSLENFGSLAAGTANLKYFAEESGWFALANSVPR